MYRPHRHVTLIAAHFSRAVRDVSLLTPIALFAALVLLAVVGTR